ncbi:MAG: bifunctional phosphoserine phosphatase/homoserine phosphotransferase ThrH [Treponema sp.]|jgi:phosphoserine/homoserine phosphotransferase|nr:bifunctional phosphoserine phosphatase/homoserine phosphotransferase ThrH [Treponema sp.]
MNIVCLDLEGVLLPEIWIAFAEATGINEFRRTTRDEPDYDKLMHSRIDTLKKHKLKLYDIQKIIEHVSPLCGALEFSNAVREKTQLIILSDTYEEFAKPLMSKLNYPTLFCNSLVVAEDGSIIDYKLRQKDGKKHAVAALKSLNIRVFAAGDSFNDLAMIREADAGCLFCAPSSIREQEAKNDVPCIDTYGELLEKISVFLRTESSS